MMASMMSMMIVLELLKTIMDSKMMTVVQMLMIHSLILTVMVFQM